MMKGSEETHRLTESVYRNIGESFNPGIRQVVVCGKAYHKALQGVSVAAKAYIDALSKVGISAKETCKGGTEEIGEAIQQLADVQREIQARIEESTKALFTEFILPVEQKLENEFRRASSEHRKYSHGHKAVVAPYTKAHDTLRKFRKKSRNKTYNDQKESQYVTTLNKHQEKLDEYRVNGLKLALLEERKCYCFLLERLCAIASMYASNHQQASDLYSHRLPVWHQLCSHPHALPPAANQLLTLAYDENFEAVNGGPMYRNANGHVQSEIGTGSPFKRSSSYRDIYRQDYHNSDLGTRTLPPRSHLVQAPPPPVSSGPPVRAIYPHPGDGDISQLRFSEGDVITVLGEKSEGWQYGMNSRTGKYGWFPLSFTEPLREYQQSNLQAHGRVKSMGDLLMDDRAVMDHSTSFEHNIPGAARRPKSLYEGSGPAQSSSPFVSVSPTSRYGSPIRQPNSPPPPPPPQNGRVRGLPPPPPTDYGTDEEEGFKRNPMFSNVSLRNTVTNDRSGPRVN